jgi:hypothetical protein
MRSESEVIHDGSRCIGHVVEVRVSRFAAYDRGKQWLGEFPNMQAAVDAIAATAKSQNKGDDNVGRDRDRREARGGDDG